MLRMVRQDIIPVLIRYKYSIAQSAYIQKQVSEDADIATETELLSVLSAGMRDITAFAQKLEEGMLAAVSGENAAEKAQAYKNTVLPVMKDLRTVVDEMERKCDRGVWPYPSYGDLLFSVR